jgi:hypothetical protein
LVILLFTFTFANIPDFQYKMLNIRGSEVLSLSSGSTWVQRAMCGPSDHDRNA